MGVSAPPTTTGMPTGRPSSVAAAGRRDPATVDVSSSGGSRSGSMPMAATTSAAQRRVAGLSSPVPDPSLGSVATSPVIRNLRASLGDMNQAAWPSNARSCLRSQSRVAAMKPVARRPPVSRVMASVPKLAVKSATSLPLR